VHADFKVSDGTGAVIAFVSGLAGPFFLAYSFPATGYLGHGQALNVATAAVVPVTLYCASRHDSWNNLASKLSNIVIRVPGRDCP